MDEKIIKLKFKADDNKKYKVKAIWDSIANANKAKKHLPGLYYLIAWKEYLEEKNTWKPSSAVWHIKKLINSFYKKHP